MVWTQSMCYRYVVFTHGAKPHDRDRTPMKIEVGIVRQKKKPRGNPDATIPHRFKKGYDPRRNVGGKPKIHQRMATMLLTELDHIAPRELSKAFGLRGARTKYEVLVAATIHRAMTTGDPNTLMALHDLTEGKLANKNFNLSVEMEAYCSDPNFRAFMEEQYSKYQLKQIGGLTLEAGADTTHIVQRLSGTAGSETEPGD